MGKEITRPIRFFQSCAAIGLTFLLLASCSTNSRRIELMPAPVVFDETLSAVFGNADFSGADVYDGILYATDRAPSEVRSDEMNYQNSRGATIRVGRGEVLYDGEALRSSELRQLSTSTARDKRSRLELGALEEFGYLHSALPYGKLTSEKDLNAVAPADVAFAGLINKKLAKSDQKDIFIFVHGYKVVFDYPLLVASEMWHFLGYDGAFIAYAWPSTPKRLAYFRDIETATLSGHNLRLFINFLAQETDAEKIHIIGFSAGTRAVITALHQISLSKAASSEKIGQVVLNSSDYDPQLFASAVADGLTDVGERTTIYMSSTDKALNLSRILFTIARLGDLEKEETVEPNVHKWLDNNERLQFVDVSNAAGSTTGDGHSYFRKSPWASSDLLTLLNFKLAPDDRGLALNYDKLVWQFPDDYPERVRAIVKERIDLK